MEELLKMPILITHFIDHKENDSNITLKEYLVHHYGGHEKDADWATDMKLPFMKMSHEMLSNFIPFLFTSFNFKPQSNSFIVSYKYPYTNIYIPNSYLNSIWQPPRI